MNCEKLPKFKSPPVVETVLGVQFDPLPKLKNAHLGAFWKTLEPEWIEIGDAPLIQPQFEEFSEKGSLIRTGLEIKLTKDVSSRLQIRNQAGDRMIQVQKDRFHYNWIHREGGVYPSYSKIYPPFEVHMRGFSEFCEKESLGQIRPNQWEITYVNRIPKGPLWESPEDWAEVLQLLHFPGGVSMVKLSGFEGEWHFEIDPEKGRLHVRIQHGRDEAAGGAETLVMTLTARGSIKEPDDQHHVNSIRRGLDLGHEAIVKTFVDLTSPKSHSEWEMVNDLR